MKKILLAILMLLTTFSRAVEPDLEVREPGIHVIKSTDKIFNYFWTGNEEKLDLNLDLIDGLEFGGTYFYKFLKDGLYCQLTCKPVPGYQFMSPEGYQLIEMTFETEFYNTADQNQVAFLIQAKAKYEGMDSDKQQIITAFETRRIQGTVETSSIDLNQKPEFLMIIDQSNKGIISLKNLLP